jgi:hypothetical protein
MTFLKILFSFMSLFTFSSKYCRTANDTVAKISAQYFKIFMFKGHTVSNGKNRVTVN